jgi:ribokinase
MNSSPHALVVLGSANRDYSVTVAHLPEPGQTLLGSGLATGTGGKGANQAAAAARAGAQPVFVGAVGDDSTGRDILSDLAVAGVDVSHVGHSNEQPTGIALITVSADGENTIVVASGANGTLLPEPTAALIAGLIGSGGVLLAQLEIPLEVLVASATAATAKGARLVLNLSPFRAVPAELLALADPLVVNESEAGDLVGEPIENERDAARVARTLLAGSKSVVITLGADGVVLADADGVDSVPAKEVTVVDSTGAGDAFAGALAAALSRGSTLRAAVSDGIDAGALAVQYLGAQPPR